MSPFQISRLKRPGLMRVWYGGGYGWEMGWYGFSGIPTEARFEKEISKLVRFMQRVDRIIDLGKSHVRRVITYLMCGVIAYN
jgi:hypothetical protein